MTSTERDAIAASRRPVTRRSMSRDLRALGVADGDVLIVHTSMSALGFVAGGAQSVVEALLDVVGVDGTTVMPTQSGQLTDPGGWQNPPVPPEWVEVLRAELPVFDPYLTPTRKMGAVVECFRQHRDTLRSDHPSMSFAAHGRHRIDVVGSHPLRPGLGETSPLGRLYELDAKVLLLGVGHANNTSLHLAEHRATWPGKTMHAEGAAIVVDGARKWVEYEDLELNENDFDRIGAAFAETGGERTAPVGEGLGRLCDQRSIVDFAVGWMSKNRSA